jgi:hypothetical protein
VSGQFAVRSSSKTRKFSITSTDSEGLQDDEYDDDGYDEHQPFESQTSFTPYIDSAIKITEIMGTRQLGLNERIVFDDFKYWAPVSDLQTALDSLIQQRQLLLKRCDKYIVFFG